MDSTTNKDSLGMMAVATSVPVRMLWEGNTDALRGGECSDASSVLWLYLEVNASVFRNMLIFFFYYQNAIIAY